MVVEGSLFVCMTCSVESSHTDGSTLHLCADNMAHLFLSDSCVMVKTSVGAL